MHQTMDRRDALRFFLALTLGSAIAAATAETSFARSASSGNGGFVTSDADGGLVLGGDINTGGKAGETIMVGDSVGPVVVNGRDISRHAEIDLNADGGLSVSDASGRNGNVAGG